MSVINLLREKSDRRTMKAMRTLEDDERNLCDDIAIETAANAILHDIDCMLAVTSFCQHCSPDLHQNLTHYVCRIESWGVGIESQRFHGKTLTLQVDVENFLIQAWIR